MTTTACPIKSANKPPHGTWQITYTCSECGCSETVNGSWEEYLDIKRHGRSCIGCSHLGWLESVAEHIMKGANRPVHCINRAERI